MCVWHWWQEGTSITTINNDQNQNPVHSKHHYERFGYTTMFKKPMGRCNKVGRIRPRGEKEEGVIAVCLQGMVPGVLG